MIPTGRQLRAARAMAGLSFGDLAELTGIGAVTIAQLETSGATGEHIPALAIIRQALEHCGIEFGQGGWLRHRDDAGGASARPSVMLSGLKHEEELRRRHLGRVTRRARKTLQLTQEEVADRIGVSVEFYARIERGHSLPSVPTLARIVAALGVSADALLHATMDMSDEAELGQQGSERNPKVK